MEFFYSTVAYRSIALLQIVLHFIGFQVNLVKFCKEATEEN